MAANMNVIFMNSGDRIMRWLAESAAAAWGKALVYQSGSLILPLLWLCCMAESRSSDLGRGMSAKRADQRTTPSAADANTAPTSDDIRVGGRSWRLAQRRASHVPTGAARMAPKEITIPIMKTATPVSPLSKRMMNGIGRDVSSTGARWRTKGILPRPERLAAPIAENQGGSATWSLNRPRPTPPMGADNSSPPLERQCTVRNLMS